MEIFHKLVKANGWRNPRPDMQKRISDGIRSISYKLAVIS